MVSHRNMFQHTVRMKVMATFCHHTIHMGFNKVKANGAVHFIDTKFERACRFIIIQLCRMIISGLLNFSLLLYQKSEEKVQFLEMSFKY